MTSNLHENNIGENRSFIGCIAFILLYGSLTFLGFIIHITTTMIAANYYNFGAAILTFILPFISEIYWFYVVFSTTGFLTPYCILITVWLVLVLISLILYLLRDRLNLSLE